MEIRPISLRDANKFVINHHRHHKQVQGSKYSIGLYDNGCMVGVAICGRPVSRKIDNGLTIEVNRLCVIDGIKNGCSMLYSACTKVAKAMGYKMAVTYILENETGISLKASGWVLDAENVGGKAWNSSGKTIRTDEITNLFGTEKKYPNVMKKRWVKNL